MVRTLSAVLALYLFWLVLSGFFTVFLMSVGFACAFAVALFGRRMEVVDREGHPVHLTWRALIYWPWLVKEIFKSAWSVSKIILDPKLPISPTLVRFKPTQRTPEGLVTHANSITLTPGTISVEVAHNEFLVHGITRESAAGTIDSDMDRRVSWLEGKP